MPAVTPVTMPVAPTEATELLLLLHTPPAVVSVKVIVEPVHTVASPDIGPGAEGVVVTVKETVVNAEPQVLLTV